MDKLQAQLSTWATEADPRIAEQYANLVTLRNRIDASLRKLNDGFTKVSDDDTLYEWSQFSQQILIILVLMTGVISLIIMIRGAKK
jgi:hypothetical protein